MKYSIFIKSWKNDLGWLCYCLRFLECHWLEPDTEVVLVLDENCRGEVDWEAFHLERLRVFYRESWPDGYCGAMYQKTLADTYCDGEMILLADSDLMLTEPSRIADYMSNERPTIPYVSYEEHLAKYPHSPWQRVTSKLTQEPAHLHYMGRTPILYYRSTFGGMRQWISELHHDSYQMVVYSDVKFDPKEFMYHPISIFDYDLLGAFAHRFESEKYDFRHEKEMPPKKWRQYHSWTEQPEVLGLHRTLQSAFSERLSSALHRNGAPNAASSLAFAEKLTSDVEASASVLDAVQQNRPNPVLED